MLSVVYVLRSMRLYVTFWLAVHGSEVQRISFLIVKTATHGVITMFSWLLQRLYKNGLQKLTLKLSQKKLSNLYLYNHTLYFPVKLLTQRKKLQRKMCHIYFKQLMIGNVILIYLSFALLVLLMFFLMLCA